MTTLAIDQSDGRIYILDRPTGVLHKFAADGTPTDWEGSASYISGNELSGLVLSSSSSGMEQVAVDSSSHEIYVTSNNMVTAFEANGEEANFTSGPNAGTNALSGFTELLGVAVDSNGTIYAADQGADVVKIFASSGELLTEFPAQSPGSIAVDTDGTVYVVHRLENCCGTFPENVFKYTPSTFPAEPATTYSVDPAPIGASEPNGVAIDPSTDDLYVTGNGLHQQVDRFTENGQFVTAVKGLDIPLSAAAYSATANVYIANTACGPGGCPSQIMVFKPKLPPPPKQPTVESLVVRDVGNTSATLRARINPNSLATTYYFEYGPEDCAVSACASVPLDPTDIGADHDPVTVSQEIAGLLANSTYHYRVVAENSLGTTTRSGTFRTQGTGLGFQLIDRRAWEMVSPPDKHGALIFAGLDFGPIQAAADGSGFAYLTGGPIEEYPAGSRSEGSTVLATRDDQGGWNSKDIMPPNSRVVPLALGAQSEYKLFNGDLSEALLEPRDGTNLSPEASGRTPYWRQNSEPPVYRPLVTAKEGFANVPPGTELGGVSIRAATPDLDHVVLTSSRPLASGAPASATYKWFDGQLEVVSVLPDAEGGGIAPEAGTAFTTAGSGPRSMRHAISDDGARVFWTSWLSESTTQHLYVRDTVANEAARVDLPSDGSGAGPSEPIFQGASADGSVAFFTDTAQLTADASPSGVDLYRCELPLSAPLAGCASLVNLSAPLSGSGESAEVLGIVSALSEDGTKVYFVARGELDTEPNQTGDSAVPGEPNLYIWQEGEGVRFIAALSERDSANWGAPSEMAPGEAVLSAAGSPNGRYLAFMSERSLSGEAHLDADWEPVERIFRYDALMEQLDCVSCNPTGAAPKGTVIDGESHEHGLIDPRFQWKGRLVAAVLPQSPVIGLTDARIPLHHTRVVHDNGRIYFNAVDALVPADSNGEWDVYQYEPSGIGTCASSEADGGTSSTAGGCISLISSGTAEGPAAFYDASVGGSDVFFQTPAALSVLDQDKEDDVYDARVDGIEATLEPPAECLGEACQPPPVVPNDPTPAGNTFQGDGNVKPKPPKRCPKGKRKVKRQGKVRCVPRKSRNNQGQKPRTGQDRRAAR